MDPRSAAILAMRRKDGESDVRIPYKHPIIGVGDVCQAHLTKQGIDMSKEQKQGEFKYNCEKHGPHNGYSCGLTYSSGCRKCRDEKANETQRRNREEKEAALMAAKNAETPNVLTVDFGSQPDLFKWIRDMAKDECRPIEFQILWLCKKAIQEAK